MKKVRFFFSSLAAVLAVAAVVTFNSGVTARPSLDALFRQTSSDCIPYSECTLTFNPNGLCVFTTYTTDNETTCSNAITSWNISPID